MPRFPSPASACPGARASAGGKGPGLVLSCHRPVQFRDTSGNRGPGAPERRMNRDEIVRGLRDLLTRQEQVKVDVAAITEDTRIDRIGFDSISILDFIYDVEDRFRVQTEMADLVAMDRVRDLIDYLEANLVRLVPASRSRPVRRLPPSPSRRGG